MTQARESHEPCEGIEVEMLVDLDEGQATDVQINGSFCIAGDLRKDFLEDLEDLISQYQVQPL